MRSLLPWNDLAVPSLNASTRAGGARLWRLIKGERRNDGPVPALLLGLLGLATGAWWATEKPRVGLAFGTLGVCWLLLAVTRWRRDHRETKSH